MDTVGGDGSGVGRISKEGEPGPDGKVQYIEQVITLRFTYGGSVWRARRRSVAEEVRVTGKR